MPDNPPKEVIDLDDDDEESVKGVDLGPPTPEKPKSKVRISYVAQRRMNNSMSTLSPPKRKPINRSRRSLTTEPLKESSSILMVNGRSSDPIEPWLPSYLGESSSASTVKKSSTNSKIVKPPRINKKVVKRPLAENGPSSSTNKKGRRMSTTSPKSGKAVPKKEVKKEPEDSSENNAEAPAENDGEGSSEVGNSSKSSISGSSTEVNAKQYDAENDCPYTYGKPRTEARTRPVFLHIDLVWPRYGPLQKFEAVPGADEHENDEENKNDDAEKENTSDDVALDKPAVVEETVTIAHDKTINNTKEETVNNSDTIRLAWPDAKRESDEEFELIDSDQRPLKFPDNRILKNYSFKIPKLCEEARRATMYGSMHVENELEVKLRSFPSRKFAKIDLEMFAKDKQHWEVQSLLRLDHEYFVLYEGWGPDTGDWQCFAVLKETAPEQLELSNMKFWFRQRLEEKKKIENKQLELENPKRISIYYEQPDIKALIEEPDHHFWVLEDLSYFHSLVLAEANQAPIFYMKSTTTLVESEIPDYQMITSNLLAKSAVKYLMSQKFNRHIDKLIEEHEAKQDSEGGCSSSAILTKEASRACPSASCKCAAKFELLYKTPYDEDRDNTDIQRLPYDSDGRIMLDDFDINKRRIIVECSDACGCDGQCPTRQTQKGRQTPLAIVYESGVKGYGVRSVKPIKKGEFLAEYTGTFDLLNLEEKTARNASYEMEFQVMGPLYRIDATQFGNESRFLSHSCDPNMFFVEIHSRANEDELLVPRCALYALRDIDVAEELTVSYYLTSQKYSRRTGTVKCECLSSNCIGFLPKL